MTSRRNASRLAALAAAASLLVAGTATAEPPPAPDRIASVNLGMQFINDAFMNRVTFRQYEETGFFDAHYDVTKNYSIDGDIAFRVWRALAFGIAVSHVAEPTKAFIDASVPNPYFFQFPRSTSGERRGLNRREIGVHVQGQLWRVYGDTFLLRATWGPTLFIVRQDLVSEIRTRESYIDFDRVSLVGHRSTTVTTGSLGVSLGFDGTLFVTERVGIGFNVRYSRGTATVRLGNRSPTAVELGGTHAAGGLRVAF